MLEYGKFLINFGSIHLVKCFIAIISLESWYKN
jgi:hypothetical protein